VPFSEVFSRIITTDIPIGLAIGALGLHLVKIVLDRIPAIIAVRNTRTVNDVVRSAVDVVVAKDVTPSQRNAALEVVKALTPALGVTPEKPPGGG
jgi:hypothetical protein